MLNFTVGPVQSDEEVLKIGGNQVPYFRTDEFSKVMLENEKLIKRFAGADESSRALFITGSGTASMEAAIINTLNKNDKVLVIDGGSFGHRFVEIMELHNINYTAIVPEKGYGITKEELKPYENKNYTAFVVNLNETSVGVLYDISIISKFCKRNNLFLIVDSISSFLCDPFDMKELNVNVMITGSQKALACAPGISIIVLNEEAINRVNSNNPCTFYLDLKKALVNADRGQTPFTPAVGILNQINKRLLNIEKQGGVNSEISRVKELAEYFRSGITEFPFEIYSKSLPNGVTSLKTIGKMKAHDLFECLKNDYGIWICPNGGELRDKVFRVGHIGNIKKEDYDMLFEALHDLQKKDIL